MNIKVTVYSRRVCVSGKEKENIERERERMMTTSVDSSSSLSPFLSPSLSLGKCFISAILSLFHTHTHTYTHTHTHTLSLLVRRAPPQDLRRKRAVSSPSSFSSSLRPSSRLRPTAAASAIQCNPKPCVFYQLDFSTISPLSLSLSLLLSLLSSAVLSRPSSLFLSLSSLGHLALSYRCQAERSLR